MDRDGNFRAAFVGNEGNATGDALMSWVDRAVGSSLLARFAGSPALLTMMFIVIVPVTTRILMAGKPDVDPIQHAFFAGSTDAQIPATMILIVLALVTIWILARRKPDDDEDVEIPPIVTFECESCGEDLNADAVPCPMCGGRVLRVETRPEAWQPGGEVRDSL
jgi:hypothetical protein